MACGGLKAMPSLIVAGLTSEILPLERTMIQFLKSFRNDEDGAVTVDWVVLTAAVVGLAIATYGVIESNTTTLINAAGTAIADEDDFTASDS